MPIYEYFCPKCKTEFELMIPLREADQPAKCPQCGVEAQKLISGFASKTGSYIQGTGKAFRKSPVEEAVK